MESETDIIQEAIRSKYGENYELGCELIARWLRFRLRNEAAVKRKKWSAGFVKKLNDKVKLTELERKGLQELLSPHLIC